MIQPPHLTAQSALDSAPGRCPRQDSLSQELVLVIVTNAGRPVSFTTTFPLASPNCQKAQCRTDFLLVLGQLGPITISGTGEAGKW